METLPLWLVLLLAPVLCEETPVKLQASPVYKGVAYRRFVREGPPTEVLLADTIRSDMRLLADTGFRWVRTYGLEFGQDQIPSLAKDFGIDTFIGLNVNENTTMEGLRGQLTKVEDMFRRDARLKPVVVVGSEVLGSRMQTLENFAAFFKYVQHRGFLAAVADTPAALLNHAYVPVLRDADIILPHIHPFVEKVQDITGKVGPHSRLTPDAAAAEYIVQVLLKAQRTYPERLVVLGETGWPKQDDTPRSNPDFCRWCSPKVQKEFLRVLASRLAANGIGMFLFEAFDQMWRLRRGGEDVGATPYWGVFNADRSPTLATAAVRDWLASDTPVQVEVATICNGMEAMSECVPAASAEDGKVQEMLDKVCGAGIICPYMDFPLMAPCGLRPKTSWALSQYYQLHDRDRSACDFDGAATIRAIAAPDDANRQNLPVLHVVAALPEPEADMEADTEAEVDEGPAAPHAPKPSHYDRLMLLGAVLGVTSLLALRAATGRTSPPLVEAMELQECSMGLSCQRYGTTVDGPRPTFLLLD